jgi:hypothetical protein
MLRNNFNLNSDLMTYVFGSLKFNQSLSRLIVEISVKHMDAFHDALSSHLESNSGGLEFLDVESRKSSAAISPIVFPETLLNNLALNKHLRSCDMTLINAT